MKGINWGMFAEHSHRVSNRQENAKKGGKNLFTRIKNQVHTRQICLKDIHLLVAVLKIVTALYVNRRDNCNTSEKL